MIRSVVIFSACLFHGSAGSTIDCALNSARAVDDLLDAATYVWASVQRCGKGKHGNEILCSMDVASVIESVNGMVNVILKGVNACGALEGETHKCGLAIGVLTKASAGVTAASSGVTAKCPNALNDHIGLTFLVTQPASDYHGKPAIASGPQAASFAHCLVDVKDLTKSLFKAARRMMTIRKSCSSERECAHTALKAVAGFAAMGQYLAGAVGRCQTESVDNTKLRQGGQCAEESLELIRQLDNVGRASLDLIEYCDIHTSRLEDLGANNSQSEGSLSSPLTKDDLDEQPAVTLLRQGATRLYNKRGGFQFMTGDFMTLVLVALLPLTAVVAFIGGSRFAKESVAVHEYESVQVTERTECEQVEGAE